MTRYKIEIPKPCHENWQEMTPSQKGRFCTNCQKEVIDFTQLSSSEISRRTKNSKNLCGRFTQSQLQQKYPFASHNKLSRLGIALGLGSIIAIAQPSFAQEKQNKKIGVYQNDTHLENEVTSIRKTNDSITISGTVTDNENLPLPGTNIIQLNTKNRTQADFDGNFSIKISKKDFNDGNLVFSFIGFETQQLKIKEKEFLISMKPNGELDEVVVTGYIHTTSRSNIFQRFFNLFRSKENKRYH